jgi:hypothetical protein
VNQIGPPVLPASDSPEARTMAAGDPNFAPQGPYEVQGRREDQQRGHEKPKQGNEVRAVAEWAQQGLNLRPLPCEGSALPLSYTPQIIKIVDD